MENQISVDARRAFIETNLAACKRSIAMSLWQIGTLLCQAKDEGVVPHGEWTAWATAHSGLNERGVQYAMRQARELSADSPLLALDDSKINALLRIPAGEREEFAERIDAKGSSSREVADAVAQYRRERDEALRLVGEQKKRMAEMDRERNEQVCSIQSTVQKERASATNLRYQLNQERKDRANVEQALRQESDTLRAEMLKSETERAVLMQQLEVERAKPASGPDPEQAQRIDQLETQLKSRDQIIRDQEREIDHLSEALDEAQTAAMRGGMAGENERTSPVTLILSAIGALMTQAGHAPAELMRMQGLDEETRTLLAGQARMAGQWAMQVLSACGEGDMHA